MSKQAEEIARKLREMLKSSPGTLIGTVQQVNADDPSVDVEIDGLVFHEVQLTSSMDNSLKGIKILPKKDSVVLVQRIGESNELFVVMFSEVDSIQWEIENMKLFVDKDGFVFNGGNNKGMVKLPELVDQLNAIQDDVNNFKQIMSSWTPVPNDGGAELKSAAASWAGQQLERTTEDDIENKDVKH